MRVLGAVLGWVLVSVQPTKDYTARKQSFTQFLTPQAQQPAGVRRGGKEERRAHDAREDRTREDRVPSPSRAHPFPRPATQTTSTAKHIDLLQVDLMNFRVEYVRPLSGRCFGREATKDFSESLQSIVTVTAWGSGECNV